MPASVEDVAIAIAAARSTDSKSLLLAVDSAKLISSESESHVVVELSAKVAAAEVAMDATVVEVSDIEGDSPTLVVAASSSSSAPVDDDAANGMEAERNVDQVSIQKLYAMCLFCKN